MSGSLRFRQSESREVGVSGRMLNTIRDNAPRIVGGLKLAGDVTAAASLNPFLMGYAAFSIVGRVILLSWGTKKNQRELAGEGSVTVSHGVLGKVAHPRAYPVEASAAFSTVAEMFETGFGVSQFGGGKTGFTALFMGLFAVWSYANILLGKEKTKSPEPERSPSLTFGASESKPMGLAGRALKALKGNPVLVSSLVQLACSVGMLAGGLIEGYGPVYMAYNTLGLLGNVVQTLFVRKNEFNVEGARADKNPPEAAIHPRSFQGHGLGLQPS